MNEQTILFIEKAKQVHGNLYDYSKVVYINRDLHVEIICSIHGSFPQTPSQHLKKYGCKYCKGFYNTEIWVAKVSLIHNNKYDYSLVNYVNSKTPVIIICPIHGKFNHRPEYHMVSGCDKCGKTYKYTSAEWIEKAKAIFGDKFDYSQTIYINVNTNITFICAIHGKITQLPSHHLNGKGCKKCNLRYKYSTAEWIEKAKTIHGDRYDYSLVVYNGKQVPIKIICKIHGVIIRTPKCHLLGSGCTKCSKKHKQSTSEFVEKALKVHGNKYNYKFTIFVNHNTNITFICPFHGIMNQLPNNHLIGAGYKKCISHYKYSTAEWIEKAKAVHGDKYDYSMTNYNGKDQPIIIKCEKHGLITTTPKNHLNGFGCRECAKTPYYLTSDWILLAKQVHGDKFGYSQTIYVNNSTKIIIDCLKHGTFSHVPSDHLRGYNGCIYCNNCPSCLLWKTHGYLCQYCKPKEINKLYYKTKEMAVVRFLHDHLPNHEFIHNRSVGSECTGGHLFPDIRFDCMWFQLIVEVDEFKHATSGYECEERRMCDITAKLGQPCVFIRYNPDSTDSNKRVLLNAVKGFLAINDLDLEEIDEKCKLLGVDDYKGYSVEYYFY